MLLLAVYIRMLDIRTENSKPAVSFFINIMSEFNVRRSRALARVPTEVGLLLAHGSSLAG